uniref:Uncharacterized protein n=3 Tax=Oryza TaxID=4527 RepID=A0A0E0IGW9_ORYNI
MPAQATGSSKRVPSVGGGKEREVLKIDSETKSNQPPTKKASSKPAPKKNDKVQGGGKGKKNPRSATWAIVVAVEVIVVAGEDSYRQIGHWGGRPKIRVGKASAPDSCGRRPPPSLRVSSTLPRHPSPPPSSGEGRGETRCGREDEEGAVATTGREERGEEARKGVGEEFRWERERERDGEESAWRERKEGRIKNERGDFECE